MSDLDSLDIALEAQARQAISTIDSLIGRFGTLQTSLAQLQNALNGTTYKREMAAVKTSSKNMADELTKTFNITNSAVKKQVKEMTRQLAQLSLAMNQGNFDGAEKADALFNTLKDTLRENSQGVEVLDEQLQDLKQTLSTMKIHVSDMIVNDFKDDFNSMRKNIVGTFTRNQSVGRSVDEAYQELQGKYPNLFPSDINAEQDQFEQMINVISNSIKTLASDVKPSMQETSETVQYYFDKMFDSLKNFANEAPQITEAFNGGALFDSDKFTEANQNIGTLAQTLQNLSTAHIGDIGLSQFANDVGILNQVKFESLNSNLEGFASAIGTMSASAPNLSGLGTGMQSLMTAMSAATSIDPRKFQTVANSISKLGTIDSIGLSNSAKAVTEMGVALSSLSGLNEASANFTTLAGAINKMGYKSTASAIENIPKLASGLADLMTTLSSAPSVSQNLIDMTNALAGLASNLHGVSTAAPKADSKLTKFFNGFGSHTSKAKTLASTFGMLYARFWIFIRLFNKLGSAITLASDLTEVENVVRTTFQGAYDSVDKFAKEAMETIGMTELSAKTYASRFQAMGTAMGLTNSATKKAGSYLEDLTDGYATASDTVANMSTNLTKLAGDMASFYNVEQDDVAEDLEAIYTGQTRPLRTYGLDLTNATLKEWALKNGLDADISSMSQAEKTMLRYQYVLANTTAAQKDYIKTHDTWANRLRYLKQQFQAFGQVIGQVFINALKPALRAMNTFMQKVISFATTISNALGAIFGWTVEISGGGITDDLEDASDSASDIGDSLSDGTGDAVDNAKKLTKQLAGFDKLNNLTFSGNSSGSGSSGSGSSSDDSSGSGTATTALKRVEGLMDKYTSSIESLYELGEYIGNTIGDSLLNIDWQSVYAKAEGFGKGLAEFLNGLNYSSLFAGLGTTIGGALNTVLHALDGFGKTFDWGAFGQSVATGLGNFIKTWDAGLTADVFNEFGIGFLTTVTEAVKTFPWDTFGAKVAEFIMDIDYAEFIDGAIDLGVVLVKATFKLAEGVMFGSNGDDGLASVFGQPYTVDEPVVVQISDQNVSVVSTSQDPSGNFWGIAWALLSGGIGTVGKPYVPDEINVGVNKNNTKVKNTGDTESIWTKIWNGITGFIGTVGKPYVPDDLNVSVDDDSVKVESKTSAWKLIWDAITDGASGLWEWVKKNIGNPISDFFDDLGEEWENTKKSAGKFVVDFGISAKDTVLEIKAKISTTASELWGSVKTGWANLSDTTVSVLASMATKASELRDKIKNGWSGLSDKTLVFTSKIATTASSLMSTFKSGWNSMKDKSLSMTASITTKASSLWQTFKKSWSNAITGLQLSIKTPHISVTWNTTSTLGKALKKMGFKGSPSFSVKYYATGGFPEEDGWFRANHGELMGKFDNGQTVVANNKQITEGIASAVYEGNRENNTLTRQEIRVLQEQNNILLQILQKSGITDQQIFDSVKKTSREYTNRTGNPAFGY